MYFQRSGLGVGVTPEVQEHITMWNRTGSTLSRGAIVQIDEAKTQAESTSTSPGVDGTMYGNVVVPATGNPLRVGTFMVYEGPSTCADNTKGLFTLVGVVDCDIEDGAVAINDVLTVQTTLELNVNAPTPVKVVAKALATRASGGVVVPCFFNGYGHAVYTSGNGGMTRYSTSINLASVAAATVAEQTFTVTGLLTTDRVLVNQPAFSTAIGVAGARVSAADTLALRIVNPTAGALDEGAATFEILAFHV